MTFRGLALMVVLPFLLASVIGCGDDPAAKPKAGKGALSPEQGKAVEMQKAVSD